MQAVFQSITCPITLSVMNDPVLAPDGRTYERDAIERCIQNSGVSPFTRESLEISELKTNLVIKQLIDEYKLGKFGQVNSVTGEIKSDENVKTLSDIEIKVDESLNKVKYKDETYISMELKINEDSLNSALTAINSEYLHPDLILVIDRSGSTGAEVTSQDNQGNKLESGLTILQIVIHAAKTIIKTVSNYTRIGVICFDDQITIVSDLKIMDENNRIKLIQDIDKIEPRYQTNIWGGIEKAIEMLDFREDKSRNSAIFLLTDGFPNIEPSRGTLETAKRLKKSKNFSTSLHTFGFGCGLKPGLLYDLAKYCNGGNGFIPDGSMIATVFCNYIGTILTTVVNNFQLNIYTDSVKMCGDFAFCYNETKKCYTYEIGGINLEQSRNLIFKYNIDEIDNFEYNYSYKIGGKLYETPLVNMKIEDISNYNNNKIYSQINRVKLIESIRKMINFNNCLKYENAKNEYNNILSFIKDTSFKDELTQGMIINLEGNGRSEGQIKLACSNEEYFKSWGEFYLDQLSRSLNQQIKPNFKDEACPFGGEVFTHIVDQASDIFDTLPPPIPPLQNRNINLLGGINSYYPAPTPPPPVDLSMFNNVEGGCFYPDTNIHLFNNFYKKAKNIRKGDQILSLKDSHCDNQAVILTEVVCVIEIQQISDQPNLVKVNDLYISPWHPIRMWPKASVWQFPNNVGECKYYSDTLYNFVLKDGHIINAEKIWAITWGHNYKVGILDHDFYGSDIIISDLKNLPGWNEGYIVMDNSYFERNMYTNTICGIKNPGFPLTSD